MSVNNGTCSIVTFATPVSTSTTDTWLCISLSYDYTGVKCSTMPIYSYFTVKQHNLFELEKVSSFVADIVTMAEMMLEILQNLHQSQRHDEERICINAAHLWK